MDFRGISKVFVFLAEPLVQNFRKSAWNLKILLKFTRFPDVKLFNCWISIYLLCLIALHCTKKPVCIIVTSSRFSWKINTISFGLLSEFAEALIQSVFVFIFVATFSFLLAVFQLRPYYIKKNFQKIIFSDLIYFGWPCD